MEVFKSIFKEFLLWILFLVLSAGVYGQCTDTGGAQDDPYPSDSTSGDAFPWMVFIARGAADPNLITGPEGYGIKRFVSVKDNMGYIIQFENDPELADAPAKLVSITYPIDVKQDMASFALGNFGFNGMIFQIPQGVNRYATRLNLIDSLGLYVDVTAGINVANRTAFWILQAIDPATGLPPLNDFIGFLPVSDSTAADSSYRAQYGNGFVNFSIKSLANAHTGDTMQAGASIIFDINDPVATNLEVHTIDALAPVSSLAAPPFSNDTIALIFSATDDNGGCGVAKYDLYVAQDSGNYATYLTDQIADTILFKGVPGSRYHFFSLATDNVGNREALKNVPDISVTIPVGNLTATITASDTTTFCAGGSVTLTAAIAPDYLWSTGATTQSIIVTSSGNYTVTENGSTSAALTVTVHPIPVINALGDTVICSGNAVTLSAGTGANYLWSTGATTQSISITSSGNYTVTESGCTSKPKSVIVNPRPTISASGPVTFCSGGSVTLTSSVATGCIWSTGATTQSIIVSTSGSYFVSLGSCSSLPVSVIVNTSPSVNAVNNQNLCAGASTTAINFSGTATSYSWTNSATAIGLASNGTGNITSFKPINAGTTPITASITVTPSSAGGCSGTPYTFTITVNPIPKITPSGTTTLCSGSSVTLIATSGSNYLWNNGATTQSISVSTGGTYTVKQSACTSLGTIINVTVSAPSTPAAITYPAGGNMVCPGSQYTYKITKVTSATSYTWKRPSSASIISGGGLNDTSVTVYFNTAIVTTDTLSVRANSDCGSSAPKILVITPNTPPKPAVIAAPVGGVKVCPGDIYTYTIRKISLVNDAVHYDWIAPLSSSIIAGGGLQDTTITLQYNSVISLRDTLSVRAGNNCSNSAYLSLVITPNTPPKPAAITAPVGGVKVCPGDIYTYTIRKISLVNDAVHYDWIAPLSSSVITGGGLQDTTITLQYNSVISLRDTLSVRAGNNCNNSAYLSLVITPNTPPKPAAITAPVGGVKVCPGDVYTYTIRKISLVNDPVHYDWIAPLSSSIIAGGGLQDTTITLQYNSVISLRDTLSIRAGNNCSNSAYLSLVITPNTPPKPAVITAPVGGVKVCPGDVYTYTIRKISLVNDPVHYDWIAPLSSSVIAGGGLLDTTITLQYSNVISLRDTLFVRAGNNCSNSAYSILVITPNSPVKPLAITAQTGGTKVCPGDVYTYSIKKIANALSYTWMLNGANGNIVHINGSGVSDTLISITYSSVLPSGNSLSVTANNNCGSSVATALSILPNTPAVPGNITGPVIGVKNSTQSYSVIPVSGIIYSWSWNIAPNPVGSAIINIPTGTSRENVTIDFRGTFCSGTLGVVATNTCNISSAAKTLAIKGVPAEAASINGPLSACALETQTYSVDPMPDATSGYTWSAPLGATINGQGTTTVDITFGNSLGNVSVFGKNLCGNGATASIAVTLGSNCRQMGALGIEEGTLALYPNPTTGKITYGFESMDEVAGTVKVYDATGRLLVNNIVSVAKGFNSYEIDLSNFAKGLYTLVLSTENTIRKGRMIKE